MALVLWLLLSVLLGQGSPFELQEAIHELQSENLQLQGKVQNLTEALSELRLFIWNRSQGSETPAEHFLREHLPCHPDTHHRNTAASYLLVPSSSVLAVMSLMAALTKVID